MLARGNKLLVVTQNRSYDKLSADLSITMKTDCFTHLSVAVSCITVFLTDQDLSYGSRDFVCGYITLQHLFMLEKVKTSDQLIDNDIQSLLKFRVCKPIKVSPRLVLLTGCSCTEIARTISNFRSIASGLRIWNVYHETIGGLHHWTLCWRLVAKSLR